MEFMITLLPSALCLPPKSHFRGDGDRLAANSSGIVERPQKFLIRGMNNYESELAWKMEVSQLIAELWGSYERHDSPLQFGVCLRGRINASTDLPLNHTRNKLYKKLVLQHLVLQLFDDSRKGSTRFVSTGIRSTKI